MNGETCISIKPLNNKEVVFIVGNSPTVTFNNNVTVYTYPKITYLDISFNEEILTKKENKNENLLVKILKTIKNTLKRV